MERRRRGGGGGGGGEAVAACCRFGHAEENDDDDEDTQPILLSVVEPKELETNSLAMRRKKHNDEGRAKEEEEEEEEEEYEATLPASPLLEDGEKEEEEEEDEEEEEEEEEYLLMLEKVEREYLEKKTTPTSSSTTTTTEEKKKKKRKEPPKDQPRLKETFPSSSSSSLSAKDKETTAHTEKEKEKEAAPPPPLTKKRRCLSSSSESVVTSSSSRTTRQTNLDAFVFRSRSPASSPSSPSSFSSASSSASSSSSNMILALRSSSLSAYASSSSTTTTTAEKEEDRGRGEHGGVVTWEAWANGRQPICPNLVTQADMEGAPRDRWDKEHVRLPCSPQNVYIRKSDPRNRLSKWDLIRDTLRGSPLLNSRQLEAAILRYNPSHASRWSFDGLHGFFEAYCTKNETEVFFGHTLRGIIELTLALKHLCKEPIPLLCKSVDQTLLLSQKQIACLLANAFLCTFPGRNAKDRKKVALPTINFNTLFAGPCVPVRAAKLRCIIHYFQRVLDDMPTGNVSFTRRVLDDFPDWTRSNRPLKRMEVRNTGTIEDDTPMDAIEVDFANKHMGGGVLGRGCVQEEIRFLINTELIVSRLFCEELDDNECILMIGSERYSKYEGYSHSFEWTGNFEDRCPRDEFHRRRTKIVAIDALELFGKSRKRKNLEEFDPVAIERELNKAYCGFMDEDRENAIKRFERAKRAKERELAKMKTSMEEHATKDKEEESELALTELPPVSTGNWGCGAFGGTKQLKSLLQFIAASQCGRDVLYFTFGEEEFATELSMLLQCIGIETAEEEGSEPSALSVGDLTTAIHEYAALLQDEESVGDLELFDYLATRFT